MTENDRNLEITSLLSRLPRVTSGDGFTNQVLSAYDQREDRGWALTSTARWSWSVAALLLVVLGFAVGAGFLPKPNSTKSQLAKSTLLKARHRALEEELARIRELSAQTAPMLYLGGEENYDLVLDLSTLINEQMLRDAQPASVQPASHQINP